MGGFFAVASKEDCVSDLFFGTDYHSHLGTQRGGMAVFDPKRGTQRFIHDITKDQFRSKFLDDLPKLQGKMGIGVISDFDDQPLVIRSHLGTYAIVTVGKITNAETLAGDLFAKNAMHFSEYKNSEINATELTAMLVNQGASFEEGIVLAQEAIQGSCSMLLLTESGILVARDRLGRTPIVLGSKEGAFAVTSESCAFANLGFETTAFVGPGEIVRVTQEGTQQRKAPGDRMQVCSFLWVYYGYPASSYEGINVEVTRNRCGASLARREKMEVDMVAGIPDSGNAHAIGYAAESGIPYRRPFVKYTPTWPRSFMPQDQPTRALVARMKLIPNQDLIRGARLLFCEDSIVRGTQLQDNVQRLFDCGAKEVHMRPACPPLIATCKFLNFSRSKSELDMAARKAICDLEGTEKIEDDCLDDYADPDSDKYQAMQERICQRLKLTSLRYQRLDDLIQAIGLPSEKLCTYCWDRSE